MRRQETPVKGKGAQPMEGGALACRSQAISDSGSEEFLADEVIATLAGTRGSCLANVYIKRGLSEATRIHGPCEISFAVRMRSAHVPAGRMGSAHALRCVWKTHALNVDALCA
jgi:hypothetical protein